MYKKIKEDKMTKKELDLWSNIHNPNNSSSMNDWADVHNPNNARYYLDNSDSDFDDCVDIYFEFEND